MYTTTSVLRTIELILGLPPMSQYDAAALPMFECFDNTPNQASFTAKAAQVPLDIRNPGTTKTAKKSAMFNLKREDAVPDRDMNEAIWKAVKGENAEMPAPKRSAFVVPVPKKKDADD
jgi:hypothetical protein